jgi:hypothetical protein
MQQQAVEIVGSEILQGVTKDCATWSDRLAAGS